MQELSHMIDSIGTVVILLGAAFFIYVMGSLVVEDVKDHAIKNYLRTHPVEEEEDE